MDKTTLTNLQHFFLVNTRIKRQMYTNPLPPPGIILSSEDYYDYVDSLNDTLPDIMTELKEVTIDFFGEDSELYQHISEIEKKILKELEKFDSRNLIQTIDFQNFFLKYFVGNSTEFEKAIQSSCIGYVTEYNLPIDQADSINKILHLIHAYIMNNEEILQSVGVLQEKTNQMGYSIVLRGVPSEKFAEVFTMFPEDLDVGWTDLVCLSNSRMLMMVRDRGHALTIEVKVEDGDARIDYFIPKICNIEMVNALPGILDKVNQNSCGAVGAIEVPASNLAETLIDFISKVPMDKDMPTVQEIIGKSF